MAADTTGPRLLTDADLDKMVEQSKSNLFTWVGSDIRMLVGNVRQERADLARLRDQLAAATRRAEEAERFMATETARYAGSVICGEVLGFLEAAGCGKPGTPNTLWAMVQEIIARATSAEAALRVQNDLALERLAALTATREQLSDTGAQLASQISARECAETRRLAAEARERALRGGMTTVLAWSQERGRSEDLCDILRSIESRARRALAEEPAPAAPSTEPKP